MTIVLLTELNKAFSLTVTSSAESNLFIELLVIGGLLIEREEMAFSFSFSHDEA